MKVSITKIIFIFLFSVSFISLAQTKTVAERLGYSKDAKLLILHADDVGVSHSENTATIEAFKQSAISSASIMVPCPWFPEIAVYAKENPERDFGLHLTLTAEWKNYKWGGVLPANEIPSLLDKNGFFYGTSDEVAENANPHEVEKELMAQVQRAIDFGINPTHLDSHMGSVFGTPALFQIYLKVGAAFNLPVFLPKNASSAYPELQKRLDGSQILVDNYYMMYKNRPKNEWTSYYIDIVKNLKSGFNVILIHVAIDDAEMQAITIDHPDFGATWRQNDLDTMVNEEFKASLKENNVHLITWGQIKKLLNEK